MFAPKSNEIMSVVSKINSNLKDRLSIVEYNDILGITNFFDPRFKTFAFYNPACAESIKEIVISSVSLIYNSELEHQIPEDTIKEYDTPKEFLICNSFISNIYHFKPREQQHRVLIIKVPSYLEDNVNPPNKDPLNWWRTNKLKYRKLYKIA